MMILQKKKALLISGSGRSGSTILSLILSQAPGTLNLGQSRDFWRAFAENRICSCGQTLVACDFWGRAAHNAFGDWSRADFLHIHELQRLFMKDVSAQSDWSSLEWQKDVKERHSEYLVALNNLLSACLSAKETVVIESSKSPEVALAYHLTGLFDVKVMSLSRDPRAVAVSWYKRTKRYDNVSRQMVEWRARETRLRQWQSQPGLQISHFSYEIFTQAPHQSLKNQLEILGLSEIFPNFRDHRQLACSWQDQHLFSPANERVLAEKPTDVVISAPNEWRSWRNWRCFLIAITKTWPQGARFVYQRLKQ